MHKDQQNFDPKKIAAFLNILADVASGWMTPDQLENVSEVPLTVTQNRRYRVLIRAKGEAEFVGNALRFDSEAEAERYARDLYSRWTAVEEWRVIEEEAA